MAGVLSFHPSKDILLRMQGLLSYVQLVISANSDEKQ